MARAVPFVFIAALALTACQRSHPSGQAQAAPAATPAPPVKPAPATPLAAKKEDLTGDSGWSPALDAFLERSLPAGLLGPQAARAVHPWCPAFAQASEADKRAFWAYTFQALAAAEAGLKPTADVHHTQRVLAKTDTVTHRPIRQEGLLQLTYEDSDRYHCDFDWPHDSRLPERSPERTILNPERNLACGLLIMQNQVVDQGKPLVTHTSYWSTLQPGTVSYRVFAKQMANVPAACGLHAHTTRHSTSRAAR